MDEWPIHGPLQCAKCFTDCNLPEAANGWRLVNDPGYWGATDPVVLVLGQSKGKTARDIYARGGPEFDKVAFAGVRDRLAEILDKIEIHLDKHLVDKHFTSAEQNFGFASLLRCSLSDPNGKTSGSPVRHAMDDELANKWIVNCMQKWLTLPNPRLRLVILFGITDDYAEKVQDRLKLLHGRSFEKINKVAAKAAGMTWIFAQHPSKISENHYQNWISTSAHKKRDAVRVLAEQALDGAGL
jgi:hypothetical protein